EEIRDALAALLGKDVEGQERVRQAFERAFPAQAPVPPPPLLMHEAAKLAFPVAAAQTREAPRVKGGRPLTWGLPIGFASVGLWLVLAQPFIGTSLPPPPGVDAGVSEPDAGEPEVAEPDAGAPSQVSPPSTWRGVPSAWGGVGAGVLVLAVAGVLAHRRYSSGRAAREALAAKAGPEEYRLPDGSRADRRSVTELAAMLASCSGARRSRRALDVAASVRRTANRAGYAEPVYARRRGEARLLVLREVGPTMQPWDWSVDQILKGLRAEGLRFELMFFSGNPDWLSERRLGRAEALSTVARERADRVVLVIGSGELLGEDWKVPPDLRGFATCAWLTPVDDPALWPAALRAENNGILVWGASPSGLLDLGRHLARGEPPSVLRQRRLAPVEANLLRAFVALSPRRTWELAHRLKRRFLPDAPDTAVLAVRSLLDEGRGGVEELRAAQEFLRRIDTQPGRPIETSVRAFIEAELRRGEPTERDSIAHLRWRKDLALVHLAGGDAKGEAFAELVALAQTVIGHEVARWREPWLEAHGFVLGRAERRKLERLSRAAGRKASGGGRWRWPGAVTFAAAAVAGVVAFYALASVLQKPREVEHVFGVVVINREIAVSLDAPVELAEDLGLYEGGTLLRTLPGSRESLHGRGAFLIPLQPGEGETLETLEVGARLTDGRFGVGVPVTPPRATLTVLAVDPSGKAVIEGTAVIACGQRVVTGRLGERMGVEGGACLASVLVGPEFEGGSREVNVPAGSASEVQIQL
ncbi:MAG TPA: hypothetical protein VFB81_07060, partial [Myxococcales bacterium]|nr:hypothetical protein [Myxococcales bacterium]